MGEGMKFEAARKELVYERVDPSNRRQIEEVSLQEREAFGTGLDPQELPLVLRFIAQKGNIWLQYVFENGQKNPTGVVEFISLTGALKFSPARIGDDLLTSPFVIAMKNQERIFRDVRKLALDKDIIYHHGIAISRKGKGYGTQLLKYALKQIPKSMVVCYIDGAKFNRDFGKTELAPNEDSYTVHLKAGFVLAGVVSPPIYDGELTHYCFIKPTKKINLKGEKIFLNLVEGDAIEVLEKIRYLTSHGYFGVEYNKKIHQMVFKRAQL